MSSSSEAKPFSWQPPALRSGKTCEKPHATPKLAPQPREWPYWADLLILRTARISRWHEKLWPAYQLINCGQFLLETTPTSVVATWLRLQIGWK